MYPSSDSENLWEDDDGYKLRLIDTDYTPYSLEKMVLETPDNLEVAFNSKGYPVRITDKSKPSNPSITINGDYSGTATVIDGAGNAYDLNYVCTVDPYGSYFFHLGSVDYKGTGASVLSTVTYSYYEKTSNLESVTYPDGKSVTYEYNDKDKLTSIKDVDGYELRITYTSGSNQKVSMVEEYSAAGTRGDFLQFEYAPFNTTIIGHSTDSSGIRREYKQFDSFGNTTCVRNEDGYAIFAAYDNGGGLMGVSDIQIPGENTLVQNWDFANELTGWTSSNYPNTYYNPGYFPGIDTYASLFSAFAATNVRQRVYLNGKVGETYSYGGWAKIKRPIGSSSGSRAGMKIDFVLDQQSIDSGYEMPTLEFNPYIADPSI